MSSVRRNQFAGDTEAATKKKKRGGIEKRAKGAWFKLGNRCQDRTSSRGSVSLSTERKPPREEEGSRRDTTINTCTTLIAH